MIPKQDLDSEDFEKVKKRVTKAIEKKLASISKAIKKANADFAKSQEFEQAQHFAELVKSHFPRLKRGMEEITVPDWKQEEEMVCISLDPKMTPQEQLEDLFKKSQKLKRAIQPLQALLTKLSGEIHLWEEAKNKIETIKELNALKTLEESLKLSQQKKAAPKAQEKRLPYKLFYSESGHEIFVGKSAKDNDELTFQIAHGSDYWLHAHSLSGSHVVIRRKRGKDVDPETIKDAVQLALYNSKARASLDREHDVLLTERKYVSRLPRTPKGQVVVSKHKTISTEIDKTRLETIKSRSKKR